MTVAAMAAMKPTRTMKTIDDDPEMPPVLGISTGRFSFALSLVL